MDEVYRYAAILALGIPATYFALKLLDYGVARFAYKTGYITDEPDFWTASMICRREEKKLEEIYERMRRGAEESIE